MQGDLQGANPGPNAATKAQPTKRAQQIEPVLRQAPRRKAPASAGTSAAYPQQVPQGHDRANASTQSIHSASSAQEALYRQKIQNALREESPDITMRSAASQKRPTSRLPAHKQRGLSPAQQAAQDLHDRCVLLPSLVGMLQHATTWPYLACAPVKMAVLGAFMQRCCGAHACCGRRLRSLTSRANKQC